MMFSMGDGDVDLYRLYRKDPNDSLLLPILHEKCKDGIYDFYCTLFSWHLRVPFQRAYA